TRFDCDWSSDVCSSDLKILQRNLDAGDLAQKRVHRRGRDAAHGAEGVAILEHALAGKIAQNADGAHEFRRVAFLAHGLAALGLRSEERRVGKECRSVGW